MKRDIRIRIGNGAINAVQLVFLILKLTGTVDWSWWCVLIPLWIVLGEILIFGILLLIISFIEKRKG